MFFFTLSSKQRNMWCRALRLQQHCMKTVATKHCVKFYYVLASVHIFSMQSPSPADIHAFVAEPCACTFICFWCVTVFDEHDKKALLETWIQHVQASTGWWKPIALENERKTWANSNVMVYKQAWHGRLAHRILRGPRATGFQEALGGLPCACCRALRLLQNAPCINSCRALRLRRIPLRSTTLCTPCEVQLTTYHEP